MRCELSALGKKKKVKIGSGAENVFSTVKTKASVNKEYIIEYIISYTDTVKYSTLSVIDDMMFSKLMR